MGDEETFIKLVDYLSIAPTDIKLSILKLYGLEKVLMLSKLFNIDLSKHIKFIMENYSSKEYMNLPNNELNVPIKNMITDRTINPDNINKLINENNIYKLIHYNAIYDIKTIEELKMINKLIKNHKMTVYWLHFNNNFNEDIKMLHKNTDITELLFGSYFDYPINKLPVNTRYLILKCFSIKSLDNLPKTLQYLELLGYNGPLNNLPPRLKTLKFNKDSSFDFPVDNLPLQGTA